eukprot:765473-Hanusia_phi.AAC.2
MSFLHVDPFDTFAQCEGAAVMGSSCIVIKHARLLPLLHRLPESTVRVPLPPHPPCDPSSLLSDLPLRSSRSS